MPINNTKSYPSYKSRGNKNTKFYQNQYATLGFTLLTFAGGVGAWLWKKHYDEVKAKEAARIAKGKWRLPDYIVDGYKHDDPDQSFEIGGGIVLSPNNEMVPMVMEWYSCTNFPSPMSSVSARSPILYKVEEELFGVHHKSKEAGHTEIKASFDLTQSSSWSSSSLDIGTLVAEPLQVVDNVEATKPDLYPAIEAKEVATETGDVDDSDNFEVNNGEGVKESSSMENGKIIGNIGNLEETT